jgi:hypothetical protein
VRFAEEWRDEPPSRDEDVSLRVAERVARARRRAPVHVVDRPERLPDNNGPKVELVVRDSVADIAIEHTKIESYPGQITDGRRIVEWGMKVRAAVEGRLPEDSGFDLGFDPHAVDGTPPTDARVARVVEWVLSTAPLLAQGQGGRQGHIAKGGPPELPVPVSLVRWPRRPSSAVLQLQITTWAPEELELEPLRRERLRAALAAKCPKLASARPPDGETMLILETDDIALSSASHVESALRALDLSHVELPDWLIFLETGLLSDVTVLRENGQWTSDGTHRGPWHVDLDDEESRATNPNARSRRGE